jgi:F-type H+-transporting ATPase subunit delta
VTASDVQTYARALYESLMGTALTQLRAAAPKLENVDPRSRDVQAQIEAALPKNALPEVKNFLLVLAREGSLKQLPSIINAFGALEQQRDEVLDAKITSAVSLGAEQREHIAKELRARYQQELRMSFEVDETLIGGLIIRVGDEVLDTSLRTRLGYVQRSMLAS